MYLVKKIFSFQTRDQSRIGINFLGAVIRTKTVSGCGYNALGVYALESSSSETKCRGVIYSFVPANIPIDMREMRAEILRPHLTRVVSRNQTLTRRGGRGLVTCYTWPSCAAGMQ
jgi:hypothetical protein